LWTEYDKLEQQAKRKWRKYGREEAVNKTFSLHEAFERDSRDKFEFCCAMAAEPLLVVFHSSRKLRNTSLYINERACGLLA
jgi:hypothetical protein